MTGSQFSPWSRQWSEVDKKVANSWLMDGPAGPRWLLPRRARPTMQFLHSWRPYRLRSRLSWQFAIFAYRWGMLGWLPGVRAVNVFASTLAVCRQLVAGDWLPVIHIGTAGPGQKLIVACIDEATGDVCAIVKVPLAPQAGNAIRHEHEVLRAIEASGLVTAPTVLKFDPSSAALALSFMQGRPVGRRLTANHVDFALSLVSTRDSLLTSSICDALARNFDAALADDEECAIATRILTKLELPTTVPSAWVHGDFAPWNLKRTPDGHLAAIDWEAAEPSSLPLFDLVYFRSIQAFLFNEQHLFSQRDLALMQLYLARCTLPAYSLWPLIRLCLLKDLVRARAYQQVERGNFLARALQAWE